MPIGVKGFQIGHPVSDETRRKISQALGRKVYFKCDYCEKLASEKPSHFAKKKRHFCSMQCYSAFRKEFLPKEEQHRFGTGADEETKAKKRKARSDLNHAVRDGIVQRKPCEVCGNKKSEAHHDDYEHALEVRWLCFVHHRLLHKNPELLEESKCSRK